MKVDGKAILKRLAASRKADREKVSLYLSKTIYAAFKASCAEVPASKVMEELMKEFVASTKERKS